MYMYVRSCCTRQFWNFVFYTLLKTLFFLNEDLSRIELGF